MAAWDGHDAEGFANLFADKFAVNDVAMPEPITTKDGSATTPRAGLRPSPT
jgi:hypothetical protein